MSKYGGIFGGIYVFMNCINLLILDCCVISVIEAAPFEKAASRFYGGCLFVFLPLIPCDFGR